MAKIDCKHIRNFSIIAHIDHGKSTLADRLLEVTGTVEQARHARANARRHGAGTGTRHHDQGPRRGDAAINHNGEEYELNLIDTPGHVDFQYEVSRSLACCEGAVLLVDAFQGVEAQTVANAYAAMEHDLTIVPVLNKIDLKHARPDEVIAEMESVLAIDPDEVLRCSGKTGVGVDELLAAIVERVPPPKGDPDGPAAGDGVRQPLRRISRRDHLRAAHERHGPQGPENPLPQGRHHARSARARPVRAAAPGLRPNCRPGRWAT